MIGLILLSFAILAIDAPRYIGDPSDCLVPVYDEINMGRTYHVEIADGSPIEASEMINRVQVAFGMWGNCVGMEPGPRETSLKLTIQVVDGVPSGHLASIQQFPATFTPDNGGSSQTIFPRATITLYTRGYNRNTGQEFTFTDVEHIRIIAHELGHWFQLKNHDCPEGIMRVPPSYSSDPGSHNPPMNVIIDGISDRECDKASLKLIRKNPYTTGTVSEDGNGGGNTGGNLEQPDDPCAQVTCPADHSCVNGACLPVSGCVIPCPPGWACMYGACVSIIVGDPDCEWPFICDDTPRSASRLISLGEDLFLVNDIDQNGLLDGAHELFRYGKRDPWDVLADYDLGQFGGNEDGRIDPGDEIWFTLRIYRPEAGFLLRETPWRHGIRWIDLER